VLPKKRGDEQKVSDVLHKILAEDPCFRIEHNAQANETVMRGLGEMHLRTVLEKMSSQYKLELDTRPPSIPYRETIASRADGHSRHKKQTGGAGQFGEVYLKIEPLPRGKGFEFVDSVKGGAIPNQFIPSVEKGVRAQMERGVAAGYPVVDIRVTLTDGKAHSVDSSDMAFQTAGALALRDAAASARTCLLEPVDEVAVLVPDELVGTVMGDLSGRRGRVLGSEPAPEDGHTVVRAEVPQLEIRRYSIELRASSHGAASYTRTFARYEPMPENVAAKLTF
jgi:elongation factor G